MDYPVFVQVSDLHVRRHGARWYDPTVGYILRNVPLLDGLLGHTHIALVALARFWHDLKSAEPDVQLLFTGDLTQRGASHQFDFGNAYLAGGGEPLLPKLRVPTWSEMAVPGNHDHWPGTFPIVGLGLGQASEFRALFPSDFAWDTSPRDLGNGRLLRFVYLNSDGNNTVGSRALFWGRGRFDRTLAQCARLLPRPVAGEARVLLVHHSTSIVGNARLAMDQASFDQLGTLVKDHRVALILTGHTHRVGLKPLPVRGVTAWEVRCGTTTQMVTLDGQALEDFGLPDDPTQEPNTLLVHRMEEDVGGLHWVVEAFWRPAAMFEPLPPELGERIGIPGKKRLLVWPG